MNERSRRTLTILGLIGAGIASLVLPSSYSDGLKHLMQLLVPFQSTLYRTGWTAAARLTDTHTGLRNPASLTDQQAREQAMLSNAVVALNSQLEQVRLENGRLKGLRDRYIPPGVRLISAQVVSPDISGWRDALLLSRGSGLDSEKKIRRNDVVASRLFVSAGEEEGARVGHLVLSREFLLGEIEQVSPFVARVRLFSDVGARTEVRIGRNVQTRDGMRFHMVDYPCTLLGQGHGRLVIEHVPDRYISESPDSTSPDAIHEGDLVVRVASPPALPTAMVVGVVKSPEPGRIPCFERDPRVPLVATVHVRAALAPEDISDVFIVAAGPE